MAKYINYNYYMNNYNNMNNQKGVKNINQLLFNNYNIYLTI